MTYVPRVHIPDAPSVTLKVTHAPTVKLSSQGFARIVVSITIKDHLGLGLHHAILGTDEAKSDFHKPSFWMGR